MGLLFVLSSLIRRCAAVIEPKSPSQMHSNCISMLSRLSLYAEYLSGRVGYSCKSVFEISFDCFTALCRITYSSWRSGGLY